MYFETSLPPLFHTSVGSGRTLRETVLESSPVLALLNQSFISSWSLVRELENLQVSSLDTLRKSASNQLTEQMLYAPVRNVLFPLLNRLMSRTVR